MAGTVRTAPCTRSWSWSDRVCGSRALPLSIFSSCSILIFHSTLGIFSETDFLNKGPWNLVAGNLVYVVVHVPVMSAKATRMMSQRLTDPVGPYIRCERICNAVELDRLTFLNPPPPQGSTTTDVESGLFQASRGVLTFQDQHVARMYVGIYTFVSTVIGWMAYGRGWRKMVGRHQYNGPSTGRHYSKLRRGIQLTT
jgi:hypothetical protein